MKRILMIAALLLAGCVQLPPTPQDVQAKKFETTADKAVIYIVRPIVDSSNSGMIVVGDLGIIATQPRSYMRWEVTPGAHRIYGFGASSAAVTVNAEAGKLYFVRHSVYGNIRTGVTTMSLQQVNEMEGRRLVEAAELL